MHAVVNLQGLANKIDRAKNAQTRIVPGIRVCVYGKKGMPALFVLLQFRKRLETLEVLPGGCFWKRPEGVRKACRKMAMELAFYVGAGGFRKEPGRFFWGVFGLMSVRSLFKVSKFQSFGFSLGHILKISKF